MSNPPVGVLATVFPSCTPTAPALATPVPQAQPETLGYTFETSRRMRDARHEPRDLGILDVRNAQPVRDRGERRARVCCERRCEQDAQVRHLLLDGPVVLGERKR